MKKTMKRFSEILLSVLLCLSMMTIPAFAASESQDGLEVTLVTDKEAYTQDEKIVAILSVKNTNDFAVNNLSLENVIPDGYKLAEDSVAVKQVESLKAGATVTLKVRYVAKTATETSEEDKDKPGTGNTDKENKPGNGSNAGTSAQPKTGDESNVVFWGVLMAGAILCIIVVIEKNKKHGKRLLSLFLCLTMAGSLVAGAVPMQVEAAGDDVKTLTVSEGIKVSNKKLTLRAVVKYQIDHNEDSDVHEFEKDSDKDGLLDSDEEVIGTDKNKIDTDGDGLTDYEETALGTDPLSPNEYDETLDTDGDGLTDIDEVHKYGTDPHSVDTDDDGLSDYDEVMKYNTKPTDLDTDKDGLSDGFEVKNGLDPTEASTDGIINDGEIILSQEIDEDSISATLKDEFNLAKPSISGEINGELSENVFLGSATESAVEDNRTIIGKAVYVDGEDSYVSGLTLSFDMSKYEGEMSELYIMKLNEEGNFDPIKTTLSGNVLSATIAQSGTYFVLNIGEFLDSLGIDVDEKTKEVVVTEAMTMNVSDDDENANDIVVGKEETEEVSVAAFSVDSSETSEETEITEYKAELDEALLANLNKINVALASSTVSGQADIVFAIDTTGSMSSTINNVVTNVTSFASSLAENYNVKVNYGLVDFKDLEEDGPETTVVVKNGSSNWFSDVNAFSSKVQTLVATGGGDTPECDIDALETARQLDWRTNSDKFIILITDTYYKTANSYGVTSINEEIELLKKDGINTSVVTTTDQQSTYRALYESTGGIFANISSSSFSSSLLALADLIGESTSDGNWVILQNGYRYVKLTEELDQDGDGISSAEELGVPVKISLLPLIELRLIAQGIPITEYSGKTTITVYKAKSDPTKADTDSDGIPDGDGSGKIIDTAPWERGLKDGIVGGFKICSYGDGAGSSAGTTGHAYIAYTSFITTDITLYGILVTSADNCAKKDGDDRIDRPENHTFTIESDEVISIGGWASWLPNKLKGSWINNEYYIFDEGKNVYADQTSLMKFITYTQMEKMESSVKTHSKWTYLYNCSAFAADVWNDTLGDDLSAKGPWASPKSLSYHMQKKEGYEIAVSMHSDWP